MPPTPNQTTSDEVKVKKEDLKAMLKRIEELEAKSKGEFVVEEPEEHTVRIRMWQAKPVSHMENVQRSGRFLPNGDEVMTCDLVFTDDTKETVDYLEFLRHCPFEVCKIVKTESNKVTVNQGFSEVLTVDGYRTVGSGVKVPNKVVMYDYLYEVLLPNGKTAKIKTPNL